MRKIGSFKTTPLASVAERSAAARSRQHRFKRRALYGCRPTRSASRLVSQFGDEALFHISLRADEGMAAGDFETYALWQRRRRTAERLLQLRKTVMPAPGGKV